MSEFLEACLLADVAPRSAKRVLIAGRPIAVVNTDEGLFAIDDRCSHADVSLAEGEVDGCAIECWLHGSAFDLRTGAPLSPPAMMSVPIYAVRVVGDGDAAVVQIDPTPISTPNRGTQ